MFVNIIKSYRNVVAICDKELIGKKFEEEKFQLDVKENFFKGKEVSIREALEIMRDMKIEDSTFNIVGEKAIKTAIEAEIISEDGIGRIQGIPFALVLM
ncbi:MAG: DUF424 family protein [Candidatus Diapherotrites archaeon]